MQRMQKLLKYYPTIKKTFKYLTYASIPFVWYKLSTCDKTYTRRYMYNRGLSVSQKFKKYFFWDKYVEPFVIKQFSIIFTAGNSFIEGMISDNENIEEMNKKMDELRLSVKDDIEHYKKKV